MAWRCGSLFFSRGALASSCLFVFLCEFFGFVLLFAFKGVVSGFILEEIPRLNTHKNSIEEEEKRRRRGIRRTQRVGSESRDRHSNTA